MLLHYNYSTLQKINQMKFVTTFYDKHHKNPQKRQKNRPNRAILAFPLRHSEACSTPKNPLNRRRRFHSQCRISFSAENFTNLQRKFISFPSLVIPTERSAWSVSLPCPLLTGRVSRSDGRRELFNLYHHDKLYLQFTLFCHSGRAAPSLSFWTSQRRG